MRILVVDDEGETRKIIASTLAKYADGCEVDTAENGQDALLRFVKSHEAANPYAFICMRHPMTGMDVLESYRLVRLYEMNHASTIPKKSSVCVISSDSDCRKRFSDAFGYDPYTTFLSHPANLFELISLINERGVTVQQAQKTTIHARKPFQLIRRHRPIDISA